MPVFLPVLSRLTTTVGFCGVSIIFSSTLRRGGDVADEAAVEELVFAAVVLTASPPPPPCFFPTRSTEPSREDNFFLEEDVDKLAPLLDVFGGEVIDGVVVP